MNSSSMLHYEYAIFSLTASILFLIFGSPNAFKSVFAKSRLTGRPTGSPLFDQNSDPRTGHPCSASTPLQAVAGQDVSAIESRTPRPRRRLELSTNSSTENSQLPSNLSQHLVHLPDFWPMNVVAYFKTIELLFNDNGVTSEHSKYASLVTALGKDKNALSKVTDILQRLDDQVPINFLDALEFTLKTDHRPIVNKFYSNTLAGSPRQQRYLNYTSQMTNKAAHVPGEKNASDFLSRSCQPSLGAILPSEPALDYFRIALSQRSDPELDQLRLGNLDSNMSFQLVQVALADHDISLLCDKSYSRLRPIIPKALRPDIFRLHHSWSHPDAKTGIKLVGQLFVWPGMRQDIRKCTRECQARARAKVQRHNISPLSTVRWPSGIEHLLLDR